MTAVIIHIPHGTTELTIKFMPEQKKSFPPDDDSDIVETTFGPLDQTKPIWPDRMPIEPTKPLWPDRMEDYDRCMSPQELREQYFQKPIVNDTEEYDPELVACWADSKLHYYRMHKKDCPGYQTVIDELDSRANKRRLGRQGKLPYSLPYNEWYAVALREQEKDRKEKARPISRPYNEWTDEDLQTFMNNCQDIHPDYDGVKDEIHRRAEVRRDDNQTAQRAELSFEQLHGRRKGQDF